MRRARRAPDREGTRGRDERGAETRAATASHAPARRELGMGLLRERTPSSSARCPRRHQILCSHPHRAPAAGTSPRRRCSFARAPHAVARLRRCAPRSRPSRVRRGSSRAVRASRPGSLARWTSPLRARRPRCRSAALSSLGVNREADVVSPRLVRRGRCLVRQLTIGRSPDSLGARGTDHLRADRWRRGRARESMRRASRRARGSRCRRARSRSVGRARGARSTCRSRR